MGKNAKNLYSTGNIRKVLDANLSKDEIYLLEFTLMHRRVHLEDFLLTLSEYSEFRAEYEAKIDAVKNLQNKLFSFI